MTRRGKFHVLVVNQHGDNRGDEAALLAMFAGIEAELGPSDFTVIHQFQNHNNGAAIRSDVEWITLRLPIFEALRFVVYCVFRLIKLRPTFILGSIGRCTIAAYESADIVISAPGGPYFGDLYIGHEPVHWLYIWVAKLHHVPAMLYATSAGPFRKTWANPFRRWTYRCFSRIFVREEISAKHIRELFTNHRHKVNVEISVDSAFQVRVPPLDRRKFLVGDRTLADLNFIAVSAINWPYTDDPNPRARQEVYDQSIIESIKTFAGEERSHVILVPQLHGTKHSDRSYLEKLASHLPHTISWEVLSDEKNSNEQRSLFAAADWVIAGRYHPAVFAVSGAVPFLCIAYEHKATGLMQLADLANAVIPIDLVTI